MKDINPLVGILPQCGKIQNKGRTFPILIIPYIECDFSALVIYEVLLWGNDFKDNKTIDSVPLRSVIGHSINDVICFGTTTKSVVTVLTLLHFVVQVTNYETFK